MWWCYIIERKITEKNGTCPNIFLPQFCIDAWIIYKNHLESLNLDEPRTGGGLRWVRYLDTSVKQIECKTILSIVRYLYFLCQYFGINLFLYLHIYTSTHIHAGLRSRNFDPDEYFFSGRRPPRVQQQYIGWGGHGRISNNTIQYMTIQWRQVCWGHDADPVPGVYPRHAGHRAPRRLL